MNNFVFDSKNIINNKYISNTFKKLREFKQSRLRTINGIDVIKHKFNNYFIYINNINKFPKKNVVEYINRKNHIIKSTGINNKYINLFYQDNINIYALNNSGCIFLNIAYFDLEQDINLFIWDWLILLCHELAHNEEHDHNSKFVFVFQKLIFEYIQNYFKK